VYESDDSNDTTYIYYLGEGIAAVCNRHYTFTVSSRSGAVRDFRTRSGDDDRRNNNILMCVYTTYHVPASGTNTI